MKYIHKCAYCSRKADAKYRGEYFCNDCKKFMRRKKVKSFLGKEQIVFSFGDFRVSHDILVKLK